MVLPEVYPPTAQTLFSERTATPERLSVLEPGLGLETTIQCSPGHMEVALAIPVLRSRMLNRRMIPQKKEEVFKRFMVFLVTHALGMPLKTKSMTGWRE